MINKNWFSSKRGILFFLFVVCIWSINLGLNYDNLHKINEKPLKDFQDLLKSPKCSEITENNSLIGLGAPWNITHWANRTDKEVDVSFGNNSYDLVELPLGGAWEGYKLEAEINNLHDTRNYCNGTMNFGDDDNISTINQNDTNWIENKFQNWTFGVFDWTTADLGYNGWENNFSGNYFDRNHVNTSGHDCLELRINGIYDFSAWGYDETDRCWWETDFNIPRGKIIDSEIRFDALAYHLADFNIFKIRVYVNNIEVYYYLSQDFQEKCGSSWDSFTIPQRLWINTSNVFSDPVNQSLVNLKISLEFSTRSSVWTGFNANYQQIFLDNIKLITESEVKPEQIGLELNQTQIKNNGDWGKGNITLKGEWTNQKVLLNYSSTDLGELSSFNITCQTNLKLYAIKKIQETTYETKPNSYGTYFSVSNDSIVNWECFVDFSILKQYKETKMMVQFPEDINITHVYEPQDPNTNRLQNCINSTPGLLIVPVDEISSTPDGFWSIKGKSNNYLNDLKIYRNGTNNPLDNNWNPTKSFHSGDYINITAKITNTPIISSYIQFTKSQLSIKLPNGTIWHNKAQSKMVDPNGNIHFNVIKIPTSGPNYQVGQYEVIVTWNNSYSTYGFNETGIVTSKFIVIHESTLSPDNNNYFIEKIFDNEIHNLKVIFNDKKDNTAIENALVYTIFKGDTEYFSEINPGIYLLEFNATKADPGNNSLTIFANSTYFINNKINLTISVIKSINLGVSSELSVPIGNPFYITLQCEDINNNFIENATIRIIGEGIDVDLVEDKVSKTYYSEINTEDLDIGIRLFTVYAEKDYFQTESIQVKINVRRIETELILSDDESNLKINPGQTASITIIFRNLDSGENIKDARVLYKWDLDEKALEFKEIKNKGIYTIDLENVPEGTYTIEITGYKNDDYEFQSIKITLVVKYPAEDLFITQLIAISSFAAALTLGIYLVIYQKVLKYPISIRKIKKFRKNINNIKKLDKLDIKSREEAFKEAFEDSIGNLIKRKNPVKLGGGTKK
ncbi:MAG: COG1470 family protein [Promethearchaeota archaeon]